MKIKWLIVLLLLAAAVSFGKVTIDSIEQILTVFSSIFIQTLKDLLSLLNQIIETYLPLLIMWKTQIIG